MTDSNSNDPEQANVAPAAEEADDSDMPLERRSAQAMVATYLQMTRYAELAQILHRARLRSTELRVERAQGLDEVERLQRQLEAQQSQGESIDTALDRFRRHTQDLKSFSDAGLTPEDFTALGLANLVDADAEPKAGSGVPPAPSEGVP